MLTIFYRIFSENQSVRNPTFDIANRIIIAYSFWDKCIDLNGILLVVVWTLVTEICGLVVVRMDASVHHLWSEQSFSLSAPLASDPTRSGLSLAHISRAARGPVHILLSLMPSWGYTKTQHCGFLWYERRINSSQVINRRQKLYW